ncbi:MAG: carbohydrate-binding domain-containing protein [Actinomycetaceae bacterium]|nr:carbohydrate-binding domain-containing protein [Actinomycetaceae bacterium]
MRRGLHSTIIAAAAISVYALSSCAFAGDTSQSVGPVSGAMGVSWSNTPQSLTVPVDEAASHPASASFKGVPSTIADIRSSHIPARVVADSEWSSESARNVAGIGKGTISIHEGGVHRLSGVHKGQIHVTAPRGENVVLLLDNLALTSPTPTAITIDADSAVIALSGNNTIRTTGGDDGAAGIVTSADLTMTGKGYLDLTTGSKVDGISTRGDLFIAGIPMTMSAGGAGLRSTSSIQIDNADLTIASHGDGIAAVNTENPGRGWVELSADSAVAINGGPSGIFASTNIIFSGGTHNIDGDHSGLTAGGTIGLDSAEIDVSANSTAVMGKGHFIATSGKATLTIPHHAKTHPIDIDGEVLLEGAGVTINGPTTPSRSDNAHGALR